MPSSFFLQYSTHVSGENLTKLTITMRYLFASATMALMSLVSAAPSSTPIDLIPRACSTLSPQPITGLDASQPNSAIHTGEFRLNRTLTPSGYKNTFSTVLTFNFIPDHATGCMLRFQLPKLSVPNQIASASPDYSGGFQADVWTYQADPLGLSTWANPLQRGQFVSTVIFPTRTTDAPYETYIWSGTCPQGGPGTSQPYGGTLSFLFEGSTWQQLSGGVRFFNTLGGKQGLVPIGFSLVFNC